MYLGKFLKAKRAEKGWSQDDISDKLGMPRSTYASYEQNRNRVDAPTMQKIASLFNMTTGELRSFAEVKAGEFLEDPTPYNTSFISKDLWQAKVQECDDLREHNKDLKLLVETQQRIVETQQKLIERLEYQIKPVNEKREGVNG